MACTLVLHERNVRGSRLGVVASALCLPSIAALTNAFSNRVHIERSEFERTLREHFGLQQSSLAYKELCTIFSLFHRSSASCSATLAEIVASLSLFCPGTKSQKLAHAFELFAEHETGGHKRAHRTSRLSHRSLWKFFRAFLSPLLMISYTTCNFAKGDQEAARARAVADAASAECTARVLKDLASGGYMQNSAITFDAFAQWYNDGGHTILSWLELLDTRKWMTE